jgi:hypothetical protein
MFVFVDFVHFAPAKNASNRRCKHQSSIVESTVHAVFHFSLLGERSVFVVLCDVGITTDRYA